MRLALVSLDQRWLDKEVNFERCGEFARKAAGHDCALVVYPEMTLTGYSLDMGVTAEPVVGSGTLEKFGKLAAETRVDMIFGANLLHSSVSLPRNSLCLASSSGKVEALYSKIHPFSFAGEEKVLEAGDALGLVQTSGLMLGCSICYDLRFPELFSLMSRQCNAVVNIANWPARRVDHWRALLIARAIENQLFVFGVNRVGVDGNGLQYEKSSMVVAPDGNVLQPVHSESEMDIYEIDPSLVGKYRNEFPTVRDKRYGLYRKLCEGVE